MSSTGTETGMNEQAEPHSNDQIGIDLDETLDDEIEDIPDGAIDPLEESLPSSQLRRIKTIAKPGTCCASFFLAESCWLCWYKIQLSLE